MDKHCSIPHCGAYLNAAGQCMNDMCTSHGDGDPRLFVPVEGDLPKDAHGGAAGEHLVGDGSDGDAYPGRA